MKGRKLKVILFVILFFLGIASLFAIARLAYVSANVSDNINFQGKITDANGVNIANGNYNFQVRIYNDPTLDTSGALVYTQTISNVQVTNGIFNLKFSPSGADLSGGNRYLQVCFDSNGTGSDSTLGCGTTATSVGDTAFDKRFTPRKLLTSNPYSLLSKFLGSNYIQGGNASDVGAGVLRFTGSQGITTPTGNEGRIYYDTTSNKFKCSENGNSYVDCFNNQTANTSQAGLLSSTDWNTFNNKQPAGSYLTSFTELDPIFSASTASSITPTNVSNWNTASSWGNHATAGYLTSFTESDPRLPTSGTSGNILTSNGTGWVSSPSTFLTSFTELDPLYSASTASSITSTNVSNWNSAYGWGDHSIAGYLKTETDPLFNTNFSAKKPMIWLKVLRINIIPQHFLAQIFLQRLRII